MLIKDDISVALNIVSRMNTDIFYTKIVFNTNLRLTNYINNKQFFVLLKVTNLH